MQQTSGSCGSLMWSEDPTFSFSRLSSFLKSFFDLRHLQPWKAELFPPASQQIRFTTLETLPNELQGTELPCAHVVCIVKVNNEPAEVKLYQSIYGAHVCWFEPSDTAAVWCPVSWTDCWLGHNRQQTEKIKKGHHHVKIRLISGLLRALLCLHSKY